MISPAQTIILYSYRGIKTFNKLESSVPYPIRYVLSRNARTLPASEFLANPELGGNCERSAYFIAQILGHEPPPDGMRPAEFFADTEIAVPVRLEDAKTGDIIGFRRPDRTDTQGLHIGVIWARNHSPTHVVHNGKTCLDI